jgi:hypothetical protein
VIGRLAAFDGVLHAARVGGEARPTMFFCIAWRGNAF